MAFIGVVATILAIFPWSIIYLLDGVNHLAPHVRAYSTHDLEQLFRQLPVKINDQKIIFGAYDNIIYRFSNPGSRLA